LLLLLLLLLLSFSPSFIREKAINFFSLFAMVFSFNNNEYNEQHGQRNAQTTMRS